MVFSKNLIKSSDLDSTFIKEIFNDKEAKTVLTCFGCGMCTSSCPIVEQFILKPHQMTRISSFGVKEHILNNNVLRFCLTCRKCQEYCPQNVDFIEFIRLMRILLLKQGLELEETHNGILSIITKIQANRQEGMKIPSELIPEGYKISRSGEVAYFFGCLPILDIIFKYVGMNSLEIAQNAIKILNKKLKEPPVIIENIKCCGHEALWKGQFDIFKKLAIHNVKLINELGIKTIITTCAECYRTLKVDYPKYVDNVNFEVIHISELIASMIENNQLEFSEIKNLKITYHDPCRLGRHMKVYDPPRSVIKHMEDNGIVFNEMERSRENSVCCGVSCFINCNDMAKAMQLDRLTEAKSVADILVTTCPKCQIHFNCILNEKKEKSSEKIELEITDLTNLIATMMGLSDEK
ncbi:MAG: (Fe-S)-binding protein [Candidatus Helarchaeota archaeon]